MTRDQVPKDCTCGTRELCPLHFVAEDFYPGALVRANPYSIAKYGLQSGDGYESGRLYHVTSVRPHKNYVGNLTISILELGPKDYHHGHFLPDRFMSMARKAIQEETDANKL